MVEHGPEGSGPLIGQGHQCHVGTSLAQRETTAAAPAELLALAKGLEAGLANSVVDGFSG